MHSSPSRRVSGRGSVRVSRRSSTIAPTTGMAQTMKMFMNPLPRRMAVRVPSTEPGSAPRMANSAGFTSSLPLR